MFTVLRNLQNGASASLEWPLQAQLTEDGLGLVTHARTITGFSIEKGKILFHAIDPYTGKESIHTFRDVVVANRIATNKYTHCLEKGLTVHDVEEVASDFILFKKVA